MGVTHTSLRLGSSHGRSRNYASSRLCDRSSNFVRVAHAYALLPCPIPISAKIKSFAFTNACAAGNSPIWRRPTSSPKVLESIWGQLGVPYRMLDNPVPEVGLQCSGLPLAERPPLVLCLAEGIGVRGRGKWLPPKNLSSSG
jgi:hypothetical protein